MTWMGGWQWFVREGGSDLYGSSAWWCSSGLYGSRPRWQWFVEEGDSDLYGSSPGGEQWFVWEGAQWFVWEEGWQRATLSFPCSRQHTATPAVALIQMAVACALQPWGGPVPHPLPFEPWCPFPSQSAAGKDDRNISGANGQVRLPVAQSSRTFGN